MLGTADSGESPNSVRLVRRSFLVGLGLTLGGLALGAFPGEASAAAPPVQPEGLRPNVFVHVAPDDTVSIVCARSEMGQGVRSSIPVLIGDELGCDVARIRIVQADGDVAYGDQNTDGSHSIRGFYDTLRRTGAVAREMLIAVAAKRWQVRPDTCEARDGLVSHGSTQRSFRFGELANDAAKLPVPAAKQVKLRPTSELRHVGKELPLVDAPDIVTGRAVYGADVRLPGMLIAVIARPPVVGGKVASFDPTRALAVPGVKHVLALAAPKRPFKFQPLGGLAVLADNTWAALRGRARLDVSWDPGDNAGYDSAAYREELIGTARAPGKMARNVGDVDAALAIAARKVDATYYVPHLAHATMEPPCAIARFVGDKCEAWASTQNPQEARKELAEALGMHESDVTVHTTLLGGGFGRKSKPDFVKEAALLSRAAGAPVRVQWSREDDLQHDYYHSVSAQNLVAGLDASGAVTAWRHRTVFPPIGSTFSDATFSGPGELQQGVIDVPLAVPNVRAENGEARAHTRIGWLRSVANIYHAFAVQSFVDEVAHAAAKDPLEMRRMLLGPARIVTPAELGVKEVPNYGQSLTEHPIDTGRHLRVLERVADACGYGDRARTGRSIGLAVHRSFLTYVAVAVSVIQRDDGRIGVDEAWISADAGTIVNLERVRSQLEGAVLFGLSHALYGEITMKNGATVQTNFRDFRLLRMKDAPRAVHVDVVRSDGPPGGIGEPGVPPVAPALANAVFALTGKRVRELPLARTISV